MNYRRLSEEHLDEILIKLKRELQENKNYHSNSDIELHDYIFFESIFNDIYKENYQMKIGMVHLNKNNKWSLKSQLKKLLFILNRFLLRSILKEIDEHNKNNLKLNYLLKEQIHLLHKENITLKNEIINLQKEKGK